MNRLRIPAVALVAAALMILTGCEDDATSPSNETAEVRVLHLSSDAPAVDVYLNEGASPAVTDLAFETGTAYVEVDAGTYQVDVTAAGSPLSSAVLTVPGLELMADGRYTAVAYDELASIKPLALEDDYSDLDSGAIRVRAIHTAPAVGQVDIWNIPVSGDPTPLVTDVDFGEVGLYADLPAGAYTLGFDVNDDAMPDVVFSLPSLPEGTVANVFAVSDGGDVFLVAQLEDGSTVRIDPDAS